MSSPDPIHSPTLAETIYWKAAKSYSLIVVGSAFFCGLVHHNLAHLLQLPHASLLVVTLELLGVSVGLLLALHFLLQEKFPSYEEHRSLLRKLVAGGRPLETLSLVLLASLGEELLFRGVLQPYLGLSMTSLAVCILHVSPLGVLTAWSAYAFCFSFLQGILFAYSHSIIPGLALGCLVHLFLFQPYRKISYVAPSP
jgi:hypothetical protein